MDKKQLDKIKKKTSYKFANSEFMTVNTETGKIEEHYKICDMCGCKCQSNKGFEMHYDTIGIAGFIRQGLCKSCSREVGSLFGEFFSKYKGLKEKHLDDRAENIVRVLGGMKL